MAQDPFEELARQEAEALKTLNRWGRLFNGVAGVTVILYLLGASLIVVPLLICCGVFTWDVLFKD